ncbi:MAG: dihydrolipoyl dehydrogenase [Chromatiales bacterium]|jgi:dihydrolipoamide dehydrogenase|nr:dihydrolipoyl dehydrogenase [Chromatiales bacterium]MDX9768009.1 dihydrolipoyl dehydrogenase [Ectothiorhodospiraceae bacterium]
MAGKQYDLIVIGAGPAGYVAALRAAQLGLSTACIDRWRDPAGKPAPGGTCLNVGCIPSKALLESSELYEHAAEKLKHHGVNCRSVDLDLKAMMTRKEQVVSTLTQGVAGLFKASGVDWLQGNGRLLAGHEVEFTPHDGKPQTLAAKHVILAPGSVPVEVGFAPFDGEHVVDSSGALAFDAVPKRLGIIGAGVIGLELGSVWRRLGAKVVLLEAQENFLAMADAQVARDALKVFTQQGLDIRLGARVTETKVHDGTVKVGYQDASGKHSVSFDRLVVAVGRVPATDGLIADEVEMVRDERGAIHVDEFCQTSVPGVYAIGDAVRGPMLAHKGSEEGIMVAERIAGHAATLDYELIPNVVYTLPEIAWVGRTEEQLKAAGTPYRSGVFPFAASGRARAMEATTGMVKILAHAETDRILGMHVIGAHASELIAEGVVAMNFGASSEDIALTTFAHPTLSEAVREAALDVLGRPLHIARRRR